MSPYYNFSSLILPLLLLPRLGEFIFVFQECCWQLLRKWILYRLILFSCLHTVFRGGILCCHNIVGWWSCDYHKCIGRFQTDHMCHDDATVTHRRTVDIISTKCMYVGVGLSVFYSSISPSLSLSLSAEYLPSHRPFPWATAPGIEVWSHQLSPRVHELHPQVDAWSVGGPPLDDGQQAGQLRQCM